MIRSILSSLLLGVPLFALDFEASGGYDIRSKHLVHPSAYIPAMCYTKTVDAQGKVHNPCYACHTQAKAPNYALGDEELQKAYDFPAPALKNPYRNLFVDFRPRIAKIDDASIRRYVARTNYFDTDGSITLRKRLLQLPPQWDENGDGRWNGYLPDCFYHFDKHGIDHAPDGQSTRWAAFAYTPFLGTFWPTNGSTDDVLIRLPESFARAKKGSEYNETIYRINLAVVESLIKRQDVAIDPVDEKILGVDLDKDGDLDTAHKITYDWAPLQGRTMSYVGEAKSLLQKRKLHLAAGLYPEGTEFLHSVRYLGFDVHDSITLAPRMKELRYAKKLLWATYADLHNKGLADLQEKDLDPDQLERFFGSMERGLGNRMGWIYQGFIEDRHGNLRPQSKEETLNCMGCHSGIGATTDGTFAFPRKLDAKSAWRRGWYHPTQKGLQGIPEPRLCDGTWEYTRYLRLNHSGNEFRSNDEVQKRFFRAEGELKTSMIKRLHKDISLLLLPSTKRALNLNKAYKALVQTQRFIQGHTPHGAPLDRTVWKEVNASQPTQVKIQRPPSCLKKPSVLR